MKEDCRVIYKKTSRRKILIAFLFGLLLGIVLSFVIISIGVRV